MSVRTTESTVTFRDALSIADSDTPLPAGTYRLIMEDEEITLA